MLSRKLYKARGLGLIVIIVSTVFIIIEIVTHTKGNHHPVINVTLSNTFMSPTKGVVKPLKNSVYDYGRDISKIDDNKRVFKKRLPSCLIIGAKKSGTRALCEFLGIHPKIRTVCAEPHFFDFDWNYKKGLEFYRNQMPKSYPDDVTIEKSAGYFLTKGVRKRIHAFNSSIKLIIILRHPVKRMISDFWHERRLKKNRGTRLSKMKFENLAFDNNGKINRNYKPLVASLYYIHIKLYLLYFPRHQIHVVDGENFIQNPVEEIAKVETFLGLNHSVTKDKVYFDEDKGFFCYRKRRKNECLKEDKGHSHPPISEKHYQALRIFFEPYKMNLFKLLGQDFNWQ